MSCEQTLNDVDSNVKSIQSNMLKETDFNQNMDDLATVLADYNSNVLIIKQYLESINNMIGLPNQTQGE